jgi:muramoyltetrapeptide carboxypeptidase
MRESLLRPPTLGPGARVALIAPAGPLTKGDLPRAKENAESLGWEPVVGDHVLEREGYFAGEDDARLEDLNEAVHDDAIDALWFLRGGYGAMRLLDEFDFDALRRRPRALIGYSDITALHAAVGRHAGLVTYHAPTARSKLPPLSRTSLERALVRGEDSLGTAEGARVLRGGRARGRLAGGNLTLLASLVGTPYMPDLSGAILVLEDVNEAVYRIDRMLRQLILAGALAGVRGIAAGYFTNSDEQEPGGGRRALDEVLHETAEMLGAPCIAGIPMGHIDDQWTIPLGAVAELDADALEMHVLDGA